MDENYESVDENQFEDEIQEEVVSQEEPKELSSLDDLKALAEERLAESGQQRRQEVGEDYSEVPKASDYEPDYTYKVKDEILEFDEPLRAAITSKETESLLRDLYTRAAGLDSYKSKLEEKESYIGELEPQVGQLVQGFRNIKDLRDEGDYMRLFKILNMSDEKVLEAAEKILDMREMPEDQRRVVERERELADKVEFLETKLSAQELKAHEEMLREEQNALSNELSSEAYSYGVNLLKEVGIDFQNEVVQLGKQMWAQTNHDPNKYPVLSDVVRQAYENRRALIERLQGQQNVQQPQGNVQTQQQVKVVERQPTLPKVSGNNGNMLEEGMTLEKLRQLSEQISY